MSRSIPRLGSCAALLIAAVHSLAATGPAAPDALRAANPDMLSGGVFAALEADAGNSPGPLIRALRAGVVDRSKGQAPVVLDARVGSNVRLGDDPAVLPANQIGQAEPHIARSASDPHLLLATFQEGRFSDAGALGCGYAISRDGGLTWSRALIPQLTPASGGAFNRATDPVAAIGPQGDLYLNTLGSITGAFTTAAVLLSRSTDGGTTWSAPIPVFRSENRQIAPDKNWMAVNDHVGSGTAGRLAVTWTNFTSTAIGDATGNHLVASTSDDRGLTWSTPVTITSPGSSNQGTQPLFLPDGSLLVVYITFARPSVITQFAIECKRSVDGGRSFPEPSTVIVPLLNGWDDPDLRDGVFLPSATVARNTGEIFVTYTAVVAGSPRVLVTRSSDSGATWTIPVVASDNPVGSSVVNPAIAATADGKTVAVMFQDKRNAPDGRNYVDTYAALSFDGGAAWQPNIRLSDRTTDIRFATFTTRGYMLGDYQAIVPPLGADQASVAIWCDARGGDADPFTARFVPSASETIDAWAAAHGGSLPAAEDGDGDTYANAVEFQLGTNPRVAESGETFHIREVTPGVFDVAWVERRTGTGYPVVTVANPAADRIVINPAHGLPLTPDLLPATAVGENLQWAGARFTVPPGTPLSVGHAYKFSAGIPPYVSGAITTANTDSRLVNVSTRGVAGTDVNRMILGFVVDGEKSVLVRAIGPALAGFDVSGVLPNPQLLVTRADGTQGMSATQATTQASAPVAAAVAAFPLGDSVRDLAIVHTVAAGGYSALVSDANGASGVALVEAYDADSEPAAATGRRIVNLSTRGRVGTGAEESLIAGFVVNGTQPRRVLVRAAGPSLSRFGVAGALADPVLTLRPTGASQPVLAANDDWEVSRSGPATAATAQRLGAFAFDSGSLDAALLVTLQPGGYTATVTGSNGATGIALVEVYDAD